MMPEINNGRSDINPSIVSSHRVEALSFGAKYRRASGPDLKRRSPELKGGWLATGRAATIGHGQSPAVASHPLGDSPLRPLEMSTTETRRGWLGRVSALST